MSTRINITYGPGIISANPHQPVVQPGSDLEFHVTGPDPNERVTIYSNSPHGGWLNGNARGTFGVPGDKEVPKGDTKIKYSIVTPFGILDPEVIIRR